MFSWLPSDELPPADKPRFDAGHDVYDDHLAGRPAAETLGTIEQRSAIERAELLDQLDQLT